MSGKNGFMLFVAYGKCASATGLQLPGILDDLFSYTGPLGGIFATEAVSLYLWAPTAQVCSVLLSHSFSFQDNTFVCNEYFLMTKIEGSLCYFINLLFLITPTKPGSASSHL